MPVNKKITALVIFGILIAALAIFLPEQEDIAFEVIGNNTDIGLNGTQERLPGVTYYANNSAIQILLAGITNANEDDVFMNLSIDGVLVQPFEFNNLPATVNIRKSSISALIPKGSSYIVQNRTNTTVEWREYPILSGRNGTLSVNITQGGGTGSQNLSQVLNQGNQAIDQKINFTNTGKWLNVGYNNQTGLMEINTSSIFYYKQGGTSLGFTGLDWAYSAFDNKAMKFGTSGSNYSSIAYNTTHGTTLRGVGSAANRFNITGFDKVNMYQELDLGLKNITNAHDIYQEFSDINMTIDNNCEDSGAPPVAKNCPRTLQQLRTNYSNVSIRHRLNPANENYGITLNTKPDLSLDNSSLTGWGMFIRSQNDDFYVGRFKPGYSEFIWRALNNDTVVFYNNITVTKNETITGLAGSGNAYVCVDATGKLYRGNPGC